MLSLPMPYGIGFQRKLMEKTNTETPVLQQILVALNERGLTGAFVQYAGSGDSMDQLDVQVTNKIGNEQFYRSLEDLPNDDTLADLLIRMLEEVEVEGGCVVEADGGSGSIIFILENDRRAIHVELNHNFSEMSDEAVLDQHAIDGIRYYLREVGAHACTVTYSGGGDSMDGFHVACEDTDGKKVPSNDQATEFAIGDIVESLINDSTESGFHEGNGGFGIVRISMAPEDSYWNHFNITDYQSSHLAFSLDGPMMVTA